MDSSIRKYFERNFPLLNGIASINIFGNYYHNKPYWMKDNLTPQEQDELAIRGDWEKVGQDMKNTISYLKKSITQKKDLSKKL
jgi:hypothetical protein